MTATTQHSRPGLLHRVGWLLALLTISSALLPAPDVEAGATICVALVVDFSPLGGNVDSGCTRVPSGATGYDVLRAGGHTFEVCNNGVIGTIDGQPANGCQVKDDTHFWGYWHRKPGSSTWSFSNYGAAVYHPVEGSTEGWVWEDGTTKPPADVPYPSGCHSPSPSPTPTASAHTGAPATTSPPSSEASESVGGSTGSARIGSIAGRPTTSNPGRHRRPAPPSPTPTGSPTSTRATAATSAPAGPSPAVRVAEPPSDASSSGHSALPVLAGVAVAALLGAGAWWRFRRPGPS